MGVAEQLTRGRRLAVEQPVLIIIAILVVVLTADLIRQVATGGQSVSGLFNYLFDGLQIGLIFGLAGIGLSMTYSILSFANFSHGDLVTSGAFFGWMTAWVVAGFGRFPSGDLFLLGAGGPIAVGELGVTVTTAPIAVMGGLLVAVGGTIVLALVLDRLVYRPMRDKGGIPLLIASIGVALAVRYALVFVWGTSRRGLTAARDIVSYRPTLVDGVITIDVHELTLVVGSVTLMLAVHILLQRTKLGKAMRAMADNKSLAQVTGIPTERVIRDTWIIGGGLAGAAGYLIALNQGSLSFNLGWLLLLFIFAAVILGGIGSVYGAMAGGLIIGMASRISLVWIPADFARAAAFAVMIVVLLWRPQGLFGGVTTA